ncbi:putative exporter of polyketide antibiotics [Brachybacterium faecium DSM 4810]|uniref:Putative exporter of polyketide antibiotics n=1 Tax=Brachybacterium faecium (strain ATCC 43885 / DSM 4810 / JCM 11609 / LMG 19847 / NBRC 14762 / NCIMB 9860 / 6-10) TaxID=446465 RepID=C7MD21_BRAFD|nr:exporter of polyketide antibiotics [Brachybacterium faecium]ACU85478.1 putative exporter of polyketide antibiotics [Brachybacterium faecium DSM 4810]
MSTAPTTRAHPSDAPTHRRDVGPASALTGLTSLIRLYGRLSRRQIILWTVAMLVLVPASILAMEEAYPDQETLDARAMLLDNPSAVMMTGPFFATDRYTFWAMVANELLLYILLAAAIMSVLVTIRHTRGEEEAGRLEMTRALPTGRLAPPAAALVIVTIANLAVGAAVSAGALMTGGGAADSLALGAATALTGLVFAAAAMVTAQLTEHAGTASGAALGLLALAFMVRGVGDVMERQGSWLSWLSPLAWAQQSRVYVDLRWWPLLVSLVAALLLLLLAGALSRRRDVGAGLWAASAGRPQASAVLQAPGGLARRLLTPTLTAWGIGLFLFALAFGALASSLTDVMEELPTIGEWAPISMDDLTGSFSAFVMRMLSVGPVALLVSGVLRLRTEEVAGRLAGVVLAGTSRLALAALWYLVVLVEITLMQVLLGAGVGLGVWSATDETAWIGDMTLAALAHLPAIALYGAVALLLHGLSARLAGLAWLLVVYTALVTFLGDLLGLPDWAVGLSPLEHVALYPSEEVDAVPLLLMGGLALALAGAGLAALRHRDLVAG